MIRSFCRVCFQVFELSDGVAGSYVDCRECGERFQIPIAGTDELPPTTTERKRKILRRPEFPEAAVRKMLEECDRLGWRAVVVADPAEINEAGAVVRYSSKMDRQHAAARIISVGKEIQELRKQPARRRSR